MALRCLLFTSDSATAEPIRQVLDGLGVEGEHCSEAVTAVERVTQQSFQIVIIDWDKQPEAGVLLTAARERKAAERPLTLAIVSDDVSVPQALQAGANSILRKPLLINQVTDTLTTARDLLRARLDSAQAAAAAAAAGPAPAGPVSSLPPLIETSGEPSGGKILRVGEFLPSAAPKPGAQFDTERDAQNTLDQSASEPVDLLKDLEPMAASVAEERPVPPPPPPPGEPRGLAWYLNARAATVPAPAQSQPGPAAPASRPERPELLGYDQAAAFSNPAPSAPAPSTSAPPSTHEAEPAPAEQPSERQHQRDQKNEAVLFAYMSGEEEPDPSRKSRFHLGKGAIIGALALAACAIVAAPQAPWHDSLHGLWGRGKKVTHAWLNPQPVTPVQAPVSHEDFGRAGDEYKLPVAENIPDATTDPSQIRVTPVVDPTIKKSNNAQANPDQSQPQPDAANPTDPAQPGASAPDGQPETATTPAVTTPAVTTPTVAQPPAGGTSSAPDPAATPSPAVFQPQPQPSQPHSDPQPVAYSPSVQPAPPSNAQPHNVSATPTQRIPSSLKSQMASMAPDASGNKPPEAAMASFEPVDVPEATERGMLSDQPAIAYPPNAKGQQGTVVLQVLIGRDGTVQDAKFMQGSLAFARAAIDGVKQWKFKPYTMNGRPVSVQTTFTMNFKPGQ